MTLEEAQAEIIRLQEENAQKDTELENYRTKVNELTEENKTVRDLNQSYFLKLSAQYEKEDVDDDEEEDVPTCEEFAKTLTI